MKKKRQARPPGSELEILIERETLMQAVASVLCEAMEKLGLDKAGLAEKLDTSRPNITQLLRGDRNMSLGKAAELAYALGIRITISAEPLARPEVKTTRWEQKGDTEWRRQKVRVASSR
ncbi:MAG: helix-turn-helix domain-containing protein [Candidatus Binatia bacterium]